MTLSTATAWGRIRYADVTLENAEREARIAHQVDRAVATAKAAAAREVSPFVVPASVAAVLEAAS